MRVKAHLFAPTFLPGFFPAFLPALSVALLVSCTARATTLECRQLPGLFDSFSRHHYAVNDVTPEIRSRTAAQFVETIDPSRTLLLESEAERLKRELVQVFDTMRSGNCKLLSEAYGLVIQRSEEDMRLAKALLTPNYKLDESVELILDPEKRGFAKTLEARADIARKMMHFQMSNYLTSGMNLEAAKKQLLHRYELVIKRLKERETKGQLPTMFAEVFASSLDPHSSYMSAETLAEFQIQMRLSLEGIGAALRSEDGMTVIESLVPGGQAEKSKRLQPKDKIIAVAQDGEKSVSTIDMELKDVVRMIRGKKGTRVTLTILREGASTTSFDVTITRDKIDVAEQAAKINYETRKVGNRTLKIGIIDLPSFYGGGGEDGGRSSYTDMKNLLAEAKREKVDGIVLDLSRNGGGLLDDAVKIAGLFIRKGGIVATRSPARDNGDRKKVEILADEDESIQYSGPLVVLTSPASASASEILAGALRDYGRAVVAGSQSTFGKGTVQVLLPLPGDLGAMKVTTGMFFLPAGESTQKTGVSSHVRVPSILDGIEVGEGSLDYSLAPETTQPFLASTVNVEDPSARWKPIGEPVLEKLRARSTERVAKDPVMEEIRKQLEESKASKGLVRLSEIRRKAEEEKAKEKAAKQKEASASKAKDSTQGKQVARSNGAVDGVTELALGETPEAPTSGERSKYETYHQASVNEGTSILVDLIELGP